MYEPSLGRFHTLDPLAINYNFQSPYLYARNNPIRYSDLLGMSAEDNVKRISYDASFRDDGSARVVENYEERRESESEVSYSENATIIKTEVEVRNTISVTETDKDGKVIESNSSTLVSYETKTTVERRHEGYHKDTHEIYSSSVPSERPGRWESGEEIGPRTQNLLNNYPDPPVKANPSPSVWGTIGEGALIILGAAAEYIIEPIIFGPLFPEMIYDDPSILYQDQEDPTI